MEKHKKSRLIRNIILCLVAAILITIIVVQQYRLNMIIPEVEKYSREDKILKNRPQVGPLRDKKEKGESVDTPELKDAEVKNMLANIHPNHNDGLWETRLFPNSELIKGFKGRYYVIDLRDALTRKKVFFEAGEYIIDDFDKKFQKSLMDFGEDVIKLLENYNSGYKIFVKGSADISGNKSFFDYLDENYKYDKIEYYSKFSGKSRFVSDVKEQKIPNKFYNKHLPNLRAAFIKEKIEDVFFEFEEKPIVLDGRVTLRVEEQDRNATMILFIPRDFIDPNYSN